MMPLIPPRRNSETLRIAANRLLVALGHEPILPRQPEPQPIEQLEERS